MVRLVTPELAARAMSVQRSTFNVQRSAFSVQRSAFSVQRRSQDIGEPHRSNITDLNFQAEAS